MPQMVKLVELATQLFQLTVKFVAIIRMVLVEYMLEDVSISMMFSQREFV